MTSVQFVNWLALLSVSAVAVWKGRSIERLGLFGIVLAFLITPLVERLDNWYQPQFGILAVDLLTLAFLSILALRYNRYWPICAAAFQAVAVLTHFAFLLEPQPLYRAYYYANFSIGFLLLGSVLGGMVFESETPIRVRRFSSLKPPSDA